MNRLATPARAVRHRLPFAVALALAAVGCGKQPDAAPGADVAVPAAIASAVPTASPAPTVANAMCAKATFEEVSAAAGASLDKVDVIDEPGLHYLDCVYLASADPYAGLTIRFVSDERLEATASQWATAAAYFDEWSGTGTAVAGVGDRAAWIPLPAGLLVLVGDQAVQVSASKVDLSDPAVRARIETLARAVVERLR